MVIIIFFIISAIFTINGKENRKQKDIAKEKATKEEFFTDLRLGIAKFDNINPLISNNKNVQEITKLVFEPLLCLTHDYKLETCLAEEWSKLNENTYFIKLKKDVKWHDGNVFKAEDVKFTIEKLKDEAQTSIYAENVKKISDVAIIDDYTIKIFLSEEIPFFEYNLIFPILSSNQFLEQDFLNFFANVVGTGKYRITEKTNKEIRFEIFDEYWDKKESKIKEIMVKLYNSVGEMYNDFKLRKY